MFMIITDLLDQIEKRSEKGTSVIEYIARATEDIPKLIQACKIMIEALEKLEHRRSSHPMKEGCAVACPKCKAEEALEKAAEVLK